MTQAHSLQGAGNVEQPEILPWLRWEGKKSIPKKTLSFDFQFPIESQNFSIHLLIWKMGAEQTTLVFSFPAVCQVPLAGLSLKDVSKRHFCFSKKKREKSIFWGKERSSPAS